MGSLFSLSLALVSILCLCLLHPWVQGPGAQVSPGGPWLQRELLRQSLCALALSPSSMPLPIPVPSPAWPLAHFCDLYPLRLLKSLPKGLSNCTEV